MIILIDQDGVIADIERGFIETWRKMFPNEEYIPLSKRKTHSQRASYKEKEEKFNNVFWSEGFFLNLPIIGGAKKAIEDMREEGYTVKICSAPISFYKFCIPEKYAWIEKNLGTEWVKEVILSRDKTLIHGDILIDDKPEVTGVNTPSWKHVLFEAPYNEHSIKPKIKSDWSNWREVIKNV